MDIKFLPQPPAPKPPTFGSLKPGDVFLGEGTKSVYMKITPVLLPGGVSERNIIRLRDGGLFTFTDGSTVIVPTQVQLHIEE